MIRRYKQLKNLYKLNDMLGNGSLAGHKTVELGKSHGLIEHAQKLHASVYLSKGFIDPNDLDENDRLHTIADPHQSHSHYFVITLDVAGLETVVATARQIEAKDSKGMSSFPIVEKAKIFNRAVAEISSQNPYACIEVSGLAKRRGVSQAAILLLYREMWYRSLRDGHTLWLMACDVKLYEKLIVLFEGAIKKIGDKTSYQGGDVIPAMARPQEILGSLIYVTKSSRLQKRVFRKKLLEFLLVDYPKALIDPLQQKELRKLKIKPYDN